MGKRKRALKICAIARALLNEKTFNAQTLKSAASAAPMHKRQPQAQSQAGRLCTT